jgi:hypothetical protein
MDKDTALRLALEALESTGENNGYHGVTQYFDERMVDQAITAIKAALEAKDEPVACKECHLKDTVYDLLGDLKVANLKLSVRSQRTWVGLTYEDKQDWIKCMPWPPEPAHLMVLIEGVELELRELNK